MQTIPRSTGWQETLCEMLEHTLKAHRNLSLFPVELLSTPGPKAVKPEGVPGGLAPSFKRTNSASREGNVSPECELSALNGIRAASVSGAASGSFSWSRSLGGSFRR